MDGVFLIGICHEMRIRDMNREIKNYSFLYDATINCRGSEINQKVFQRERFLRFYRSFIRCIESNYLGSYNGSKFSYNFNRD